MKTDKKILRSASVFAGALLTTTLSAAPEAKMDLLAYQDLGSGAQVRSELIDLNTGHTAASESMAYKFGEEDKKTEGKKTEGKKTEGKKAEAKKAEGKEAESKKAEAKKSESESKSKEAKCGEGKCG